MRTADETRPKNVALLYCMKTATNTTSSDSVVPKPTPTSGVPTSSTVKVNTPMNQTTNNPGTITAYMN